MRVAAALFVLLVGVGSAPPAAAARESSLCDILPPLERLLGCDGAAEPAPVAQKPTAAPPGADGADSPLEDAPSERRLGGPRPDPARLLVRFAPGTSEDDAARAARAAGGLLERRIDAIGIDVVRAEPAQLADVRVQLEESTLVRSTAPEQLLAATGVEPNDAQWSAQHGLRITRFVDAWAATRGSADTVVAVVDTGVWAAHPDLEGAVLPGYDAVNGDGDATDDHGHGTAVAGIIAARTNNGVGIAGVCWLCRILPVKVLSAEGFGPSGAVAEGIVWAADHGADVINVSLGSPAGTEALTRAVAYAVEKGIVVVAAAGNEGVPAQFFPAAEPGVVSVAATDDRDRRYSWSNYGAWVELAAPGCLPTTTLGGGYGVECGTSFASPIVAGLAALGYAAQPGLSAATVTDALRRSAVPLGGVVRAGRVDAAATIAALPRPQRAGQRTSTVVRATLTELRPSRTFEVAVGKGLLDVTVKFAAARTLTVTILDARGRAIARERGRSPLRLSRTVAAGAYRVRVSGGPVRFVLVVARTAARS